MNNSLEEISSWLVHTAFWAYQIASQNARSEWALPCKKVDPVYTGEDTWQELNENGLFQK